MATSTGDGIRLSVRVRPRASREAIDGWRGDTLAVRVSAAPVDGEANRAVATLLAGALGIPRSAVAVVGGTRARDKVVRVAGLTHAEVKARLGAPRSREADTTGRKEVRR